MKFYTFIWCLFLLIYSCSDDPVINTSEPSNLNIDVTLGQEGKAMIIATGDNVVEYQFDLGDAASETITNTSGRVEYAYTVTGTFIIEVRAYGASGRFIKKTRQVTIILEEDIDLSNGYSTPMRYAEMDLVWSDEFDEDLLNDSKWTHEIGDGCPGLCGWGNNELQYYRKQNTDLVNGVLRIEAREEGFQERAYTSSRIISKNKFSFQYGRVDIRARLPKGKGIWPALWMLGANIDQVGWPRCGEIDIMEMVGGSGRENTIHGTAHWHQDEKTQSGADFTLGNGRFDEAFHVFSLLWDEQEICWLVDDERYYSLNITDPALSEFQQDFFLIMNIAVGGNWPGSPDGTTLFPTNMYVDYVRVFQKK